MSLVIACTVSPDMRLLRPSLPNVCFVLGCLLLVLDWSGRPVLVLGCLSGWLSA